MSCPCSPIEAETWTLAKQKPTAKTKMLTESLTHGSSVDDLHPNVRIKTKRRYLHKLVFQIFRLEPRPQVGIHGVQGAGCGDASGQATAYRSSERITRCWHLSKVCCLSVLIGLYISRFLGCYANMQMQIFIGCNAADVLDSQCRSYIRKGTSKRWKWSKRTCSSCISLHRL